MKAREGVLDLLNQYLTIELTTINQYFLASEMCANWGFDRLHDRFRVLSLAEMKDAQELIAHILYLEGVPNLQRLNQIKVGQDVPETLQAGLESERAAVDFLRGAIDHCARVGDYTTRGMFEETIHEEEEHVDWFETQLVAIRLVGLENYLSQQLHTAASSSD
jgi:bacterioferritin